MEIGGSMLSSLSLTGSDGIVRTSGNQTIRGVKTFLVNPISATVPVTDSELVNKLYVDSTISGGGFVTLNTTQTIVSDKIFDSSTTTTFDGAVVSTNTLGMAAATLSGQLSMGVASSILTNGLVITDDEVSYLDGVTSNIQTQINSKATDSLVVHLAGTESITGLKTFSSLITGTSNINISGLSNNTINSSQNNTIGCGTFPRFLKLQANSNDKITIDDISTAITNQNMNISTTGSAGNDLIIGASGGGGVTISNTTGDNTITTASGSNKLSIGSTPKITTTSADNTISNKNNTITCTALGETILKQGTTSRFSVLQYSNNISGADFNLFTVNNGGNTAIKVFNGTTDVEKIRVSGTSNDLTNTTNYIESSGTTATSNVIAAINGGGGNKLSVTTGENLLTATTGTNKLTTANTTAEANLIDATAANAGNTIRVKGGDNYLHATTSGRNLLQAETGMNYLKSNASTGNGNYIQCSQGANNYLSTTGIGTNTVIALGSGNNLIESTTGSNVLQINGTPKITTTSTLTTIANTDIHLTATGEVSIAYTNANHRIANRTDGTNSFMDFLNNGSQTDYDNRILCNGSGGSGAGNAGKGSMYCYGGGYSTGLTVYGFQISYMAGSGTKAVSVNNGGYIIFTPSDRRLKENIQTIDANETHLKILQLRPITYEWIDKKEWGTGTEIGLIAQEVMEHIPQLVWKDEKEDKYGVHYDRIPTLLLQSVKELQRQIDELKEMVRILSSK